MFGSSARTAPTTAAARARFLPYLLVLAALPLVGEAIHALWQPWGSLYGVDSYQFLDAARRLVATGLPSIGYWPNSSAGLDMLFWSHHLLPYVYALGVWLLDIQRGGLEAFFCVELILTVALASLVLKRLLPLPVAVVAAVFLLYEPAFHFLVFEKQYMRWPILMGFAAIACLVAIRQAPGDRTAVTLAAACGALTALSPLFFISQGAPIALGVGVAFLFEVYLADVSTRNKVARLASFCLGGVVPVLLVAAYLAWQVDTQTWRAVLQSIGYYGDNVAPKLSLRHEALTLGYFFSTLVVSPYGLSVLPLGLAAGVLNLSRWRDLGKADRAATRLTAICIGAWLALALLVPSHFYSARMAWLVPLLIVQLWLVMRDHRALPGGPAPYLLAAAIVVVVQMAHHQGGFTSPYSVGIAAALALVLAGSASWIAARRRRATGTEPISSAGQRAAILVVAAVLCLPAAQRSLHQLTVELPEVLANAGQPSMAATVAPAVRALLAPHVQAGDWVVTDLPMTEILPPGVRIQSVQDYRGLFTGGRAEPGKVMLLFNRGDVPGAPTPETVYYRGFVYEVEPALRLPHEYWIRIGRPVDIPANQAQSKRDAVTTEDLQRYLEWRRANGLAVE